MLLKKSGNFISLLFYPVLFVNRVVGFSHDVGYGFDYEVFMF